MTTAVADPPQPSTATLPVKTGDATGATAAAQVDPAKATAEGAGAAAPAKEGAAAPRQTLLSDITGEAKPEAKAGEQPKADAKPDDKAKPAEAAPAEPKPEDYSALKAPDKSGLDAAHVAAVTELAKAQKLTAAQAQALIDRDAKLVADLKAKDQAGVQAAHDKLYEDWSGQVKADKEFGGDKLVATQSAAKQALAKYGDPELRTFLANSPFGNHPLLMRLLARVGKAMAEDGTTAQSTPRGDAQRDPVSVFYPKMAAKRK